MELSQLFHWAYKVRRKKVVMVTLTFPHKAWHRLEHLLDAQALALKKLREGMPWTRVKDRAGFEGLVRSLELTHGRNGWHPHTHELWVVDQDCDADWLKARVIDRWASACKRAGLLSDDQEADFRERAVDLHDEAHEGDYLAKQDSDDNLKGYWGADHEMAKASTKEGRRKGRHPFGLLADAELGDNKAAALYLEYAETMKSRRKAQMYWGPGLKDLVGVAEKKDEELAAEQVEKADLLALLTQRQWQGILEAKARAKVLELAEKEGRAGIARLLKDLNLPPLMGSISPVQTPSGSNPTGSSAGTSSQSVEPCPAPVRPFVPVAELLSALRLGVRPGPGDGRSPGSARPTPG